MSPLLDDEDDAGYTEDPQGGVDIGISQGASDDDDFNEPAEAAVTIAEDGDEAEDDS